MGKRIFIILVSFQFFMHVNLFGQPPAVSISNLEKHLYVLASDSIEGRATGTPGQKKAAKYIANHFNEVGLAKLSNNTFYQKYNLHKQHTNTLKLEINGDALLSPWHFFSVSGYNHNDTIVGDIVFAGFATDKELSLINADAVSLVFIANNPTEAYKAIRRVYYQHRIRNFFVIFPQTNSDMEKQWEANYQLTKYNLPHKHQLKQDKLCHESWAFPVDSVNICYCSTDVLEDVFNCSDKQLAELASLSYSSDSINLSQVISPVAKLFMNFNDSLESVEVENVAGVIYGKDTNQTIVVSAHYDHLGTSDGDIYYGADDNASGSSALLELARVCAEKAKIETPKRNILFISYSGEEIGLLGSEFYVQNPIFNLDSTVLNINMDMIGRCDTKHVKDSNYVYLLNAGKGANQYFKLASSKIEKAKGFNVSKNPGAYEKQVFIRGSDHYSLYNKHVPVSVLFTGLHDDYHTPNDTPDKINYRNLSQITDLTYKYIWVIANDAEKYPVRFKK